MRQRRGGDLALFSIYSVCYAGFVLIAAFRQDWMAWPVFAGINLAVVYGMALIIGAIVLAMVAAILHRGEGAEP